MNKYVCIHGHFYQPPRENPWLEAVELQDSAQPYHDWNERIAAECYAPNAFARLLDGDGRIERIVSNYSRMSFNFGPTLLMWMKEYAPDVHAAIVSSDRESVRRFSGHGSAMAQCYNHMIMPLAHPRDRITQVRWGLSDFESRFGRKAEGMWLPECAADVASLDALAQHEVKFTVLSPFQASQVLPPGAKEWQDVNGGRVDPSRPYRVQLPSGRSITVFFYDAPLSQAVAFERLLSDGGRFAGRLLEGFDDAREGDQLVHIATDGESYGHHHRHGEMALAYALNRIETEGIAKLTNYGEFLEKHPAEWEAKIHEGSAWSCPHGVGRWTRHCGCNSGGRPGWNQQWREPLRHALDWLRDGLAPLYEERAREFLRDPWGAREDYIHLILDRSTESQNRFFERQQLRVLEPGERITALRLLELQRHAMLMYTSCGWFFDELSGLETVQVIQYAARVIQLASGLLERELEQGFLDILKNARSNLGQYEDGGRIYEWMVKPAIMDRERVGAHYAVSSLFESYPPVARIYAFTIEQEDRRVLSAGNARLALGRARVTFEVTGNADVFTYGVLHLGDHNLNCGVRHYLGPEAYESLLREMEETFNRADFPQVIRLMDRHFGESNYSLKNLFRDEQRKVLDQILESTLDDLHNTYRLITDRYTPLLRYLADLRAPAPHALRVAHEFVVNSELRRQLSSDSVDHERVRTLLQGAQRDHAVLDMENLAYAAKSNLDRLVDLWRKLPLDEELNGRLLGMAELVRNLPFEVNLWKPQNAYAMLRGTVGVEQKSAAQAGDAQAAAWLEGFRRLGEQLGFRVEAPGSGKTG